MRGFVVGHSRSGTMWTANALRIATDLDARHEAMQKTVGADYGGVEVNSYLWDQVDAIRALYPRAKIVHLVRDPRAVVRSVLSRRPGEPVEVACRRWRDRNEPLLRSIPARFRYRLEDLTTDFFSSFYEFASFLGARGVSEPAWASIRSTRFNRNPRPRRDTFPRFLDWNGDDRETFFRYCGDLGRAFGYDL